MSTRINEVAGRPKIAMIISNLYLLGGTERVTALLSAELSEYYDVTVITLFGAEPLAYPMDPRVTIYSLYTERRRIRHIFPQALFRLHEYLQQQDIHTVMLVGRNNGPIPVMLGLYPDIRLIACEHSTVVPTWRGGSLKERAFVKVINQMIGHLATLIVLLTAKEKTIYTSLVPASLAKLCVIPNFMDDNILASVSSYDMGSRVICTVGRIERDKGVEHVLDVAERVFAAHPYWEWRLYGTGEPEYLDYYEGEIARRNLAGRLRLMGPTKEVYRVMSESAIYVSASRYEGLPMVLLEAKASRLPCVAFDVYSGPSDIIRDGIDGYLVEPFDTAAMAERLCYLIEHPERRLELAASAWGNIDRFRRENVMQQWQGLLDEVLATTAPTPSAPMGGRHDG